MCVCRIGESGEEENQEVGLMKLNSLRTKFLAGFLPMFVGSFFVFFAISYYMSSNAMFNSADMISKEIGKSTALQIEKTYLEKEMVVEGLALNQGIISGDREQRTKIMANLKSRTTGFAMLAYSDVSGKAYSDTGKDMDRSSRDYIKKVRETKKPYMTGPSISGSTGKLITVMAYPVLDNGNLMFTARLNSTRFQKLRAVSSIWKLAVSILPIRKAWLSLMHSSRMMLASWIFPRRHQIRQSIKL